MSSPASLKPEGSDRKETSDLKISAVLANHPPPRSTDPATSNSVAAERDGDEQEFLHMNGDSAIQTNAPTSETTKKLPPSPLVTPPMGSNPSEAAQQAVSPRNLLAPAALEDPPPAATRTTTTSPTGSPGRKPKHEQKGIPHVYHDYSKLSGPGPAYIRKKTGGVTQPFPDKLHEMLSQESSDDPASAIVSWLPHGRAFIVRKPKEFTTEIMPKYFRQTKLTSFQRQLNLYGFRRITQGADSGAYYHALFLQGRPSISQRMVRQKVKGTGHKQPSDASSEPNFYAMPPVEPEYPHTSTFGARYKSTILPPMMQQQPVTTVMGPGQPQQPQASASHGVDPNSPGFSSLHGAAQLLHGISAAGRSGAFLGPPAASAAGGVSALGSPKQKPASFLHPEQLEPRHHAPDPSEYTNIQGV